MVAAAVKTSDAFSDRADSLIPVFYLPTGGRFQLGRGLGFGEPFSGSMAGFKPAPAYPLFRITIYCSIQLSYTDIAEVFHAPRIYGKLLLLCRVFWVCAFAPCVRFFAFLGTHHLSTSPCILSPHGRAIDFLFLGPSQPSHTSVGVIISSMSMFAGRGEFMG